VAESDAGGVDRPGGDHRGGVGDRLLAVGTGAQRRIAAAFEAMGSFNVVIRPGTITRGGYDGIG